MQKTRKNKYFIDSILDNNNNNNNNINNNNNNNNNDNNNKNYGLNKLMYKKKASKYYLENKEAIKEKSKNW